MGFLSDLLHPCPLGVRTLFPLPPWTRVTERKPPLLSPTNGFLEESFLISMEANKKVFTDVEVNCQCHECTGDFRLR